MDKRRIITIILIILVILGIVLGISWLLTRKKAENRGVTPPSFKSFLGLGGENTNTIDGTGPDGELSSVFTGAPGSNADGSGTNSSTNSNEFDEDGLDGESDDDTRVSNFTDGTISPTSGSTNGSGTGINGGGSVIGSGGVTDGGGFTSGGFTGERGSIGTGGNVINSGGAGTGSTGDGTGLGSTTSSMALQECTDADLNITFTPEEQAKLQALQIRFYAIAQNLHTDADAAMELANYDGFKAKADKLNDLLVTDCQPIAQKVAAANPLYQKKVPTPFWYEPKEIRLNNARWFYYDPVTGLANQDIELSSGVPLGYLMDSGQIGGKQTTTGDKANGMRALEKVLRLNLW